MSSPFPGMDPYLERHWLDVHTALVAQARVVLNGTLPEDLVASAEERVAVESEEDRAMMIGPDVRINTVTYEAEPAEGAVAIAPIRLVAQVDPILERFVRIFEFATGRLITVIEFVSPTNMRSRKGVRAFRKNRNELLGGGVNVVEIDLVRTGNKHALLAPHVCPARAATAYRVTIRVPDEPDAVSLYPMSLRAPLPEIVIPLRRSDAEVRLNLQALIEHTYATGRYDRKLDYKAEPKPRLPPEDAEWADALLRKAGRR